MRSTHRRNHVCQIFSRSVQGLRSSDTPKLPFPIDLLLRPYNSVGPTQYALPCDTVISVLCSPKSKQLNKPQFCCVRFCGIAWPAGAVVLPPSVLVFGIFFALCTTFYDLPTFDGTDRWRDKIRAQNCDLHRQCNAIGAWHRTSYTKGSDFPTLPFWSRSGCGKKVTPSAFLLVCARKDIWPVKLCTNSLC